MAFWSLPPGIEHILRNLLAELKLDKHKYAFDSEKEKSRLALFHNIHKGERCFILATGPSIKTQDLRPLKNEICIAVSQFMLHPDIKIINPLYHIEAPMHPPLDFTYLQGCFEAYKNIYTEKVNYFFGYYHYEYSIINFLNQYKEYSHPNINFIDFTRSRFLDEANHQNNTVWDITRSPFVARTVIYIAIQVAFYMGFKEIYLLGCDHDYLLNLSRTADYHFYKDEESNTGKTESEHYNSFNAEWWFNQYYHRWKEYRLMGEYLAARGCRILNATNGGMLDVFPRVKLEDILAGKK
jgi:hypothetical protein